LRNSQTGIKNNKYPINANPSAFSFIVQSLTSDTFLLAQPFAAPKVKAISMKAQIMDVAMIYFATHGMDGTTRELAKEVGITQAALFRHFKNKEDLYRQTYAMTLEKMWDPKWCALLANENISIIDRWSQFHNEFYTTPYYVAVIRMHAFERRNAAINKIEYRTIMREKLMVPLCKALRKFNGYENLSTPITEYEVGFVWSIHSIFYADTLRTQLFGSALLINPNVMAKAVITSIVHGSKEVHASLINNTSDQIKPCDYKEELLAA